jgi:hypothetical protein
MTRTKLSPISVLLLAVASGGLVSCVIDTQTGTTKKADGETSTTDAGDSGGDGDGDGKPGDGDGGPGDGDGGTGDGETGDGETGDGETGDGDGDPGDGDGDPGDGDGDDGGPAGLADGEPCMSDTACISGHCFEMGVFGGRCGECDEDPDCAGGGCTAFNPFGEGGPACNLGQQGGGCQSTDVCEQGLQCVTLFAFTDMVSLQTCSTCATEAECEELEFCEPIFDTATWQGSNECVMPGTLGIDSYCDLEGHGNEVCASKICSIVDVPGLDQIGACGECNTDADCKAGTCVAGSFDIAKGVLTGSSCQ